MFNVSFISDIDTAKLYVQFLRSQTCSRLGLLTVEATLPSSSFVRSFQLLYIGLSVFPFISCLQNLHFSMTMISPNIWIFAIFLQFFKLLSWQIKVYMIMLSVQLLSFELRGFIFHNIPKKTRKEFEQFSVTKILICSSVVYQVHYGNRSFRSMVRSLQVRLCQSIADRSMKQSVRSAKKSVHSTYEKSSKSF